MTDDSVHRCSICQKPAYFSYFFYARSKGDNDQGLYEIGCSECGEYRIAADAEAAMAKEASAHRAAIVRLIQAANDRGNRFCLNDGREVTLNSIATPGGLSSVNSLPSARPRESRPAE